MGARRQSVHILWLSQQSKPHCCFLQLCVSLLDFAKKKTLFQKTLFQKMLFKPALRQPGLQSWIRRAGAGVADAGIKSDEGSGTCGMLKEGTRKERARETKQKPRRKGRKLPLRRNRRTPQLSGNPRKPQH